jgi:trehalose 6-phosphate synthase
VNTVDLIADHQIPADDGSDDKEVIVASHRGPVEHFLNPDGELVARRGSGGLMTALAALGERLPFTWVASAMTPGDRLVALRGERVPIGEADGEVRYVTVPDRVYNSHYHVFSNPMLWFVQHGLADRLGPLLGPSDLWQAWVDGYKPVNVAFADTIARAARTPDPLVFIHDYQLYTTPGALRDRLPGARILHFCHIPWPEPEAWSPMPLVLRRELLRGLLGSDIVGFQDERSAERFLRTCRANLPEATVDFSTRTVRIGGREVRTQVYPISVDPSSLRAEMRSHRAQQYCREMESRRGEFTFVRVDRVDPSKNIAAGFQAFSRLLERRPELVGRAKFLAFLVPSRSEIPEYRQEYTDVMDAIGQINARFGRPGYQPVEYFYENNWDQALAGMSVADAIVVNSLADGMNLVAKEAPVVNDRGAALILSNQTGAWYELRNGAIGVDPFSIEDTVRAMETAMDMPLSERLARATRLRHAIESHDIWEWLDEQYDDLTHLGGVTPKRVVEALTTA